MDVIAKANDLRSQRAELTHKMLETQLALAKIRRAWLVDGQQTPIAVRANLEYELARLELARHTLDRELAIVEKLRREANAATFQVRLVSALEARGLGSVVDEVKRSLGREPTASQAGQQLSMHPGEPSTP